MSTLSVGGAIRQLLVDANLPGITAIYRDFGPPNAEKPYISYWDELRNMPQLTGDGVVKGRLREVQVDIWQDKTHENFELGNIVVAALDGVKKIEATNYIYQIRVTDIQRLVSSQDNLIHHAISLEVYTKA
jgi:hypothetical protein